MDVLHEGELTVHIFWLLLWWWLFEGAVVVEMLEELAGVDCLDGDCGYMW